MSDLISRSALLAEYDRVHVGPPGGARKLMEEAPAVDAVEVVRCKDCKHCRISHPTGKPTPFYYCIDQIRTVVRAESFCSYGEREEDD